MEPVAYLPEPLGVVEIPRCLAVTRIAASGPCLLRAVAPLAGIPLGPVGPRAEFGRLVHHLCDLTATGRIGSDGIPEAFEYLLEETRLRLSAADDTRPYANLCVAFKKREWEKRRFLAIARATEVARKRRSPQHPPSGHTVEPLSLNSFLRRSMPAASEVPFRSDTLRIQGRLDLVEFQTADNVQISDYKSRNIADSDGTPTEAILIQLRLYGLAVIDSVPSKRISLRALGPNGEISIPFGDAERKSTLEWLMSRLKRLPVGAHIKATQLASIGPQCKGCAVRPVCPLYREAVRHLWNMTHGPFALPLDIAGTVIEWGTQQNGCVSLKLMDLGGRIVKVHRLLPRRGVPSRTGQFLWFFDLASIETTASEGPWRHPRNFHETASMPGELTAWTVRIFDADT